MTDTRGTPPPQPQMVGGDEAEINPNCREELRQAALMIRTYIPLSFPENEAGQVHFVRAICESVADVIERAIATPVASAEVEG